MPNAATVSALLLLALAGGFVFAYWFHFTRYLVARAEGQELYLITAVAAACLVLLSRLFLSLAQYHIVPESDWSQIRQVWVAYAGSIGMPGLATFVGAFLLGPVLAPLANKVLGANLVLRGTSVSRFVIEKYATELERMS